ncbi:MAG: S-layer homology domain-containing protein [Oscillibacter sp.]
MKISLRKTLALFLAFSLLWSVGLTAAASEALGEDLTAKEILVNQQTQLSTNVFWSTAYSDLRTENLITYTPNQFVTPVVTYGGVLTACNTISSMAKTLEAEGKRVVAGLNGDFYNVSTGLPIGLVVTEGTLRSTDGGYYAIGFRADGSAIMGKPAVKISADLGYSATDASGFTTQIIRAVTGVNKARVSTGGIYLYTYDFNSRHTTGTTEPGVDVVCTITSGQLSIGDTVTLTVDRVLDGASATPIGENQLVLSANSLSDAYHTNALRNIPVGSTVTLSVSASDAGWNDVDYAVGSLYSLVENGGVVSGLAAGVNPRTAVGQKPDGSLVFYTIDGRKSGHSIGASLTQVAQRLVELGCVTALCLDGGGSTTLTVTAPDSTTAKTINRPSGGAERAVTNQVFLVAKNSPSGDLSHFYVNADNQYVLAGSRVNISASAVDSHYLPMDRSYSLTASAGTMDDHLLTTPAAGGDITVTAAANGKSGATVVHAVTTPDSITVRNGATAITTLAAVPGSVIPLTPSAIYKHMSLKADPDAFTWTVSGDIGTISRDGVFTAGAPGNGSITVSAGGKSVTLAVTVSKIALSAVENFEGDNLAIAFTDLAMGATMTQAKDAEHVRMGRAAGKLDYALGADGTASVGAYHSFSSVYSLMNLWVYGDNSGNTLTLLTSDGSTETQTDAVILDFAGWRHISVKLPAGATTLTGLRMVGRGEITLDPATGAEMMYYPVSAGTVYLDQMTASYGSIVDEAAPVITAKLEGLSLTGTVLDEVDGVPARSAVSVTLDGKPVDFSYNTATGAVSATLAVADTNGHRVSIAARDGSGNLARTACDIVSTSATPAFSDTANHWAAPFVDFLKTGGITNGYDDGSFRPDKNISRQEFSVMLFRYLGLDAAKYEHVVLPFADSASIGAFAQTAVKALYTEGVVNGSTGKDGQSYFNPASSLTRAQAAAMIGRTQEKGYPTAALTFTDAAAIPAYATYYVQTLAAQGVIGGYADGSFKPGANTTRGQMAKILYNLL